MSNKKINILLTLLFVFFVPSVVRSENCPVQVDRPYKSLQNRSVYFVSSDCKKRPIKNPDIFFSHFDSWSQVGVVNKPLIDSIANHELSFLPWGKKSYFKSGSLLKTVDDPKVYLIIDHSKYPILQESVFNDLGLVWQWVEDVDQRVLDKYTTGREVADKKDYPQGLVYKNENSPDVFKLNTIGADEHIATMAGLMSVYRSDRIAVRSNQTNPTSVSTPESAQDQNSSSTPILPPQPPLLGEPVQTSPDPVQTLEQNSQTQIPQLPEPLPEPQTQAEPLPPTNSISVPTNPNQEPDQNSQSVSPEILSTGLAPKKLLVYYGYPSSINGSGGSVDLAVPHFAHYDYVILGETLENPSHGDHTETRLIVSNPAVDHVKFYGYINPEQNIDINTVKTKIDQWLDLGVDGIFVDIFGYDYDMTRLRQNEVVDYIHSRGYPAFVNGWNPDDVFGAQIHPIYNPSGVATSLGSNDLYLSESYQITNGQYRVESQWREKQNKLNNYKNQLGFKILAVTTYDARAYDQNRFNYAWYSSIIDQLEAFGWGYDHFSQSNQPYIERPNTNVGNSFTSGISANGSVYTRQTDVGEIRIDAKNFSFSLN